MEIASPYSLSRRVPSATRPPLRGPVSARARGQCKGWAPRRYVAVSHAVYSRAMFLFREKTKLIEPGPRAAGPGHADPRARAPRRARHPAEAAVPRADGAARRRPRLLLGRRAAVLAARRRLHDGGRLRGRLHAEPDLRGGLQRLDRPHRGRARRVRPREDRARRDPAHVLGGPRPDAGHAPGQRRRHAVPLRRSTTGPTSSAPRSRPRASATRRR